MLRFSTAGESHGEALVALVSGLPAGVPVDLEFISRELWRRQKGYGRGGRMRIERDAAKAANADLAARVQDLAATNAELANGREADQRAAAAAVDALTAKNKTLVAQLAAAKSQREVIYAHDPHAATWARQPVPAAVADRLRH